MPWSFAWFPPGQNPTDGTGIPVMLTNPPNYLVKYQSLLGASGPPYVPVTQDIPFRPGSHLKFIKVEEAEVDLRWIIQGFLPGTLWTTMQQFPKLFNPLNGEGTLQITNPSGDTRYLTCVCISGFKMDPTSYYETSIEIPLTFFANYPFWKSIPFLISIVPVPISESSLFDLFPIGIYPVDATVVDQLITNDGDVNTGNLVVTFHGPLTDVTLINTSLGGGVPFIVRERGVLSINGLNVTPGQRFQISFAPKTVTQGVKFPINQISKVSVDSNFWPLIPGDNVIQIVGQGMTDQTDVTFEWTDTYSTMI